MSPKNKAFSFIMQPSSLGTKINLMVQQKQGDDMVVPVGN